MGRVEENKQQKKNSLMETAFQLFTSQGITKTTISDIVEKAGMAKGTFYLYFRDKYDLQDTLIIHKSQQLFEHAMNFSGYETKTAAEDKILAIVDDILFQLQKNPRLLRFINKNLSWGVFRRVIDRAETDFPSVFREILGDDIPDGKLLEIEVYTILELVGSTCHSVILESEPTDLESYLPYLHRSVRAVLQSFRQEAE